MAGVHDATSKSATYSSAQTNIDVVGTPGADRRLVVHWAVLSNGGTAGEILLRDGPSISASITANSQANPTVVTCGVYVPTGTTVTITGSNSTPTIDGTHTATNVNSTSFSIPVNVTVAGTAGTVTAVGTLLADALLAINTPAVIDAHRAPIVLSEAEPLCMTSTSVVAHRINVGYSIEPA